MSSRREVAIVLYLCDCSQHIPSRGTVRSDRRTALPFRQTLIYLVRIPHRLSHSIQSDVQVTHAIFMAATTATTVQLELAQAGGISGCVSSPDRTIVRIDLSYSSCKFVRLLIEFHLSPDYCVATFRHSLQVFPVLSMCQISVASFLITATRAIPLPLLRLMRLNQSRS